MFEDDNSIYPEWKLTYPLPAGTFESMILLFPRSDMLVPTFSGCTGMVIYPSSTTTIPEFLGISPSSMHLARSWRCNHKLSIVEVLKLPSPGNSPSWRVQKDVRCSGRFIENDGPKHHKKEHTIPQQPIAYLHPPKEAHEQQSSNVLGTISNERYILITVNMPVWIGNPFTQRWSLRGHGWSKPADAVEKRFSEPSESQFCWLTKRRDYIPEN